MQIGAIIKNNNIVTTSYFIIFCWTGWFPAHASSIASLVSLHHTIAIVSGSWRSQ